jgi:hypothetical protein
MYEMQTLALRALCGLLGKGGRTDWDELAAANRALIKAIATGRPMTQKNVRIVAEYLREAGWNEGAIGAATTDTRHHGRPHRGRISRDRHVEAEAGGGPSAHPGDRGGQGQRVQAIA